MPEPDYSPLLLSLEVASWSLLLGLPVALILGYLTARRQWPGKTLITTLMMAPLVLPPVVTGYLLLACFGRSGLLGGVLESLGLQIAFTRWGAVLAAAVVGFPLLVLLIRQAIEAVDPRYEEMARTLGHGPWSVFARVTLPMAAPGIAAGCAIAFARALGEFGATVVLAGNTPGETRTLALAVYSLLETPGGQRGAAILVWCSIGVSMVALAGYEWLVRVQRRRLEIDV